MLLAAGAVTAGLPADPAAAPAPAVRGCPAGQLPEQDSTLAAYASGHLGSCAPALHAEGTELMQANEQLSARETAPFATTASGAYAAAVAQKQHIEATSTAPESSAPWKPLGGPALHADNAGYGEVNGLGLGGLSGRIQSFAYDPASPTHWYAGVSAGGVFETTDDKTWHSVGDGLPTQLVGAIAFVPATASTPAHLLAGTGDPSFGGDAIAGLGAYWSDDDGAHWHKAAGVPDGTETWRIAVDPATPSTDYLASGKGLYRSTDGGETWTNVVLPSTCTSTTDPTCFFANIVTDVVVRTPDAGGKGAHEVLAALGWRAGQKLNAQGKPQAPQNGLYLSTDGSPGSFSYLNSPSGFATTQQDGRIALGAATGAAQNHDFVYALVQDATKFQGTTTGELDLPNPDGTVPANTYLKGLYVSADFGRTWHLLTGPTQLGTTSGTSLVGANSVSYAPGIQSWYNEWVAVDPTTANASGSPTRVAMGLEEIYENQLPLTDAQTASTDTTPFKAIGAYFKGTSCAGLNTNLPVCPANINSPVASTTTHPDQHAAMFVPDASGGGVTLVAGSDGGAYSQHVAAGYGLTNPAGDDFDNGQWGEGINDGLHTLQPYIARMAKDGTVYGGLQDNGNLKITPSGQEIETYGGDGFFAAVDPDDSKTTYEEYTYGAIAASTDGGMTWTAIAPPNASSSTALFAAPFVMDPLDANHLLAGNTQLVETTHGATTDTNNTGLGSAAGDVEQWVPVFDLGTSPTAAGGTTNNIPSAVDLRGADAYAAYCGYCDIVTGGLPFHSGLATNVGGSKPAKIGTSDGWHLAAGKGLPQRYITSVKMDPADPETVYVTMGGYGRRWIPPGSLGDDTSKIGTGHVFVSHDAGATFTDITGNLPDVSANDTVLQKGRLLVATDVGTFFSTTPNGKSFQQLGSGLPAAPVFTLEIAPRNQQELVAATYGRGVYDLVLPATTAKGPTTTTSPTTRKAVTKKPATRKPTTVKATTGTLAYTGLSGGLALAGLLALLAAAGVRRRLARR